MSSGLPQFNRLWPLTSEALLHCPFPTGGLCLSRRSVRTFCGWYRLVGAFLRLGCSRVGGCLRVCGAQWWSGSALGFLLCFILKLYVLRDMFLFVKIFLIFLLQIGPILVLSLDDILIISVLVDFLLVSLFLFL